MMNWSSLAGAVAWPLTALVIFFTLRLQAMALLDALRVKLGQAERVSIGKDGLTLISTIARQNVLAASPSHRGVGPTGPNAAGLPKAPIEDPAAEFERLVGDYGSCNIPDLAERIRTRRRLADRLGELALSLRLNRRDLAASGVEGRIVALATAVILSPQANDLVTLDVAAQRADYNFTRYRIVLALPPALTIEHDGNATGLALSVLTHAGARPNTDSDLRSLIEATRKAIQP